MSRSAFVRSGCVLGILNRPFGTTQTASSYPGLTSWATFSHFQPPLRGSKVPRNLPPLGDEKSKSHMLS